MRKGVVWAGLLLAAGAARAQVQEQVQEQEGPGSRGARQQEGPASAGGTGSAAGSGSADASSDAFDRACVDLLHGKTPQGDKAIRALRDACANLMAGRADEKLEAEKQRQAQLAARDQVRMQAEGRVEPGRATASPEAGEGILAAFGSAAAELRGANRTKALGMRQRGPVGYSLITNPVGWFGGLGANAELFGAFMDVPKFSWVAGARYSQTDASNGTASTFGAMGGVDFFIIGRNNEGLRIGPRAELAAGRERFQGSTTYARLGMSGEIGYNFIATNGITGLLAGGLGGRVAGDSQNDDYASFVGGEFGPYLKFGLGYSW
jgi:hypothetical protein